MGKKWFKIFIKNNNSIFVTVEQNMFVHKKNLTYILNAAIT